MSKLAITLIKPFIRGFKLAVYNQEKAWFRFPIRGKFNSGIPLFRDQVKVQHTDLEGIPCGIFTPKVIKQEAVLLYLHGGGFSVCNYRMYTHLISAISLESGIEVFAIDYRLAPEHPFPNGLDDCVRAFQIIRDKHPEARIFIGGDSAGGGLTFSTALKLKQLGEKMPDKLFAFSPWADLRITADSFTEKAKSDPLIDGSSAKKWAERYLHGESAENPLASPVLGDFKDFPPCLIHVGEDEVLLDDSLLLVDRLKSYGIEVHFKQWEGMMHVFQIMVPMLDEAKQSLKDLKAFLE
ncbi:MAG: alpha/beta hydrolase [Flavobacteriales bacterium]